VEQFELVAKLEGVGIVWTSYQALPPVLLWASLRCDHKTLKAIVNIPQSSGRLAS